MFTMKANKVIAFTPSVKNVYKNSAYLFNVAGAVIMSIVANV